MYIDQNTLAAYGSPTPQQQQQQQQQQQGVRRSRKDIEEEQNESFIDRLLPQIAPSALVDFYPTVRAHFEQKLKEALALLVVGKVRILNISDVLGPPHYPPMFFASALSALKKSNTYIVRRSGNPKTGELHLDKYGNAIFYAYLNPEVWCADLKRHREDSEFVIADPSLLEQGQEQEHEQELDAAEEDGEIAGA